MPACIVNGCQNHASNNFGVRLRREDTSAIWAPNTEAYICDVHASSGFDIVVQRVRLEKGNYPTLSVLS